MQSLLHVISFSISPKQIHLLRRRDLCDLIDGNDNRIACSGLYLLILLLCDLISRILILLIIVEGQVIAALLIFITLIIAEVFLCIIDFFVTCSSAVNVRSYCQRQI